MGSFFTVIAQTVTREVSGISGALLAPTLDGVGGDVDVFGG